MNKTLVSLISRLAPRLVVGFAYNQLTHPQVRKLREHELALLGTAKQEDYAFHGFNIKVYKWGDPKDNGIIMIHGWEGQAGNFSDIIKALLDRSFFIVTFDAPAHGFSSSGDTSLFEFTDLVYEMLEKYKPTYLISHSFGGVATTYALSRQPEVSIKKYILLTTPDKFSERIDQVAQAVGITEKVKLLLIDKIEKEMAIDVSTANVSQFVKSIPVQEAIIIHDKEDKVIPLQQSQNVARNWPESRLVEITGTGHFRILRDERVIDMINSLLEE